MPLFSSYPSFLPYFNELHDNKSLEKLIEELGQKDNTDKPESLPDKKSHPFMDAFHKMANMTLTDNGAVTNLSTHNPILDLYYKISSSSPSTLKTMLQEAWDTDPLTTMHIIFYTRSIHRGKSLTSPFFYAYCWLLIHHPRTALANLHILIDGTIRTDAKLQAKKNEERKQKQAKAEGWDILDDAEVTEETDEVLLPRRDFKTHGYWKDLCTLLTIYCQDELEGPSKDNDFQYLALHWPRISPNIEARKAKRAAKRSKNEADGTESIKDMEENKKKCVEYNKIQQELASTARLNKRVLRNKKVCDLLENDKTYRALHFTIAKLFADQMKQDMAQIEMNKISIALNKSGSQNRYALSNNVSLAGKWAPTLCASHDKHTFLATSIAELLFPPEEYQEKDESRVRYLNKVRDLYRKEYLTPLRKVLDLTEHYMEPGKWDAVDFRHIPAVCLQNNIGLFFKHSPDTVINYMNEVANGKRKVSGATLGPHQLVYQIYENRINKRLDEALQNIPEALEKFKNANKNLINGQWNTLIESIQKIDLSECLVICDTSGSMFAYVCPDKPEERPIYAAIGLSLVVSNLAKPPFNGAMITFSDNPSLFEIDISRPFDEQVAAVFEHSSGLNTDICKVFTDVLLPMAKKYNLAPKDMVKHLFVFSDMEFDAAHNGVDTYMTTQEFIHKQYKDAGYEVPEVIWWNLSGINGLSTTTRTITPVTQDDTGVSLLSGFSASMLKTFLDGDINIEDEESEKNDNPEEQEEGEKNKQEEDPKKETPLDFVMKAVYHESFNGIVVVD
ncbi:uncharacterized protein BX663DRAFT_502100 [Cokeromyces recurvatus]|uniref:uncharacterized protein n=1 Tax=Cokeromyces recurvatus TaxID=90255 RepID=UPI002220BB50|nr:uncharacterized protein BX663DRAFT_502100 [Cokeromyces recurvatus]KAI7905201.1 hypothetical protein BX663DRAFT_502100 [Cokeromyces recurvatus]